MEHGANMASWSGLFVDVSLIVNQLCELEAVAY